VFFARPAVGLGLIPPGIVEGSLECYLTIGGTVPLIMETTRLQPGLRRRTRGFFPFLNSNIGPMSFRFALKATTGQEIRTFYQNLIAPPIGIAYVGSRIRGWVGDVSIVKEILEQQR
jgi:hypothetical protein